MLLQQKIIFFLTALKKTAFSGLKWFTMSLSIDKYNMNFHVYVAGLDQKTPQLVSAGAVHCMCLTGKTSAYMTTITIHYEGSELAFL